MSPVVNRQLVVLLRGLAGAILGGVLGYFAFRWLSARNLFGYAVPGGMIGLCAGLAAGGRSQSVAIFCAIAALCLAIYLEWTVAPFRQDKSLLFFLTHLHRLDDLITKAVITAVGVACAYWLGQGR